MVDAGTVFVEDVESSSSSEGAATVTGSNEGNLESGGML
jgi:hypothetical protein